MKGVLVNRGEKGVRGAREPRRLQSADNLIITVHDLSPPQVLLISHRGERETRVIGGEAQRTMERRCEK